MFSFSSHTSSIMFQYRYRDFIDRVNQNTKKWKFLPKVMQVISSRYAVQIMQVGPWPRGNGAVLSAYLLFFLCLDAAVQSDSYSGFVEHRYSNPWGLNKYFLLLSLSQNNVLFSFVGWGNVGLYHVLIIHYLNIFECKISRNCSYMEAFLSLWLVVNVIGGECLLIKKKSKKTLCIVHECLFKSCPLPAFWIELNTYLFPFIYSKVPKLGFSIVHMTLLPLLSSTVYSPYLFSLSSLSVVYFSILKPT